MTTFTRIADLMIASHGGDTLHSVGFDVNAFDWPEIQRSLMACDTNNTLSFRVQDGPYDPSRNVRSQPYRFVWVTMTNETTLPVLMCLAKLKDEFKAMIEFRPEAFP